jgi:hypothetical protein
MKVGNKGDGPAEPLKRSGVCTRWVLLRLRSSNCSGNADRKLIGRLLGQAGVGVAGVLTASCRVGCTRAATDRWQLIDGAFRISSPRIIMSTVPSTSTSHSNFVSIFNTALETYKRKTKKDLASHPLLPSLQSCESSEAVLTVLREQTPAFSQSQNGEGRLTKLVTPIVNVLYSFSATIGGGVGLVNISMFPREELLL